MTDQEVIKEFYKLNARIQNNPGDTDSMLSDSNRLIEITKIIKERGLLSNGQQLNETKIDYNENIRESLIQGIPALIFGLITLIPAIKMFQHSGFNFLALFLGIIVGFFTLLGIFQFILLMLSLIAKASQK